MKTNLKTVVAIMLLGLSTSLFAVETTLTLDANGGNFGTTSISTIKLEQGKKLSKQKSSIIDPNKQGLTHKLKGWYDAPTGGVKFDITNGVITTPTLTLYAQWENETIQDVEGNKYPTVRIGEDVWMQSSLRATKFADGKPLDLINSSETFQRKKRLPAYANCGFSDIADNIEMYGRLYNSSAVFAPNQFIEGWHISTAADWTNMISFILPTYSPGTAETPEHVRGSFSVATLKATTEQGWYGVSPGTNYSGFKVLNGGYCVNGIVMEWKGMSSDPTPPKQYTARFATSTMISGDKYLNANMTTNSTGLSWGGWEFNMALFSVRLVKNKE
ncbi:MAG: hypothetical protein GZ091_08225 [Paludibacter sp.]|nr:hypothetical protein [Paludibacter sp.]